MITNEDKLRGLKDTIKFVSEGYGGMNKNGNIVDRRIHPNAVPMEKNDLLNIPAPKKVNPEQFIVAGCGFITKEGALKFKYDMGYSDNVCSPNVLE